MNSEQIKDYLYAVIDAEKNKYIQEKTIKRLQENANVLGIKPKRQQPVHYKENYQSERTGCGMSLLVFIVSVVICTIMISLLQGGLRDFNIRISDDNMAMITIILSAIAAVVYYIFLFLKNESKNRQAEQQRLDEEYEGQLREYKDLLIRDEAAFDIEINQKQYIYRQINLLKEQLNNTNREIEELYNYGVLDEKYWHNIVALCSFYEYFRSKRTYSLCFDPKTGDEGAYEKYEKESRMDGFIKRADIIIKKLDKIIDNQKSTATMIMEASNRVNTLSASVMNAAKRITSTVEDNAAIIQYNQERQLALDEQRNSLIFLDVLSNIDRKN